MFKKKKLPLKLQVIQWEKKFKACIAQSFTKIRITKKKKETESQKLIKERNNLRNILKTVQDDFELERANKDIEDIESKLSNLISDENTQKVKEHLTIMSSVDGQFNQTGFWKTKKKLFPKNGEALPISKINSEGR